MIRNRCFQCKKMLHDLRGNSVPYVDRTVGTQRIKMHPQCAELFAKNKPGMHRGEVIPEQVFLEDI